MAAPRGAVCVLLFLSTLELGLVSSTGLNMNETVLTLNLPHSVKAKSEMTILEIAAAVTNTSNTSHIAMALNVSVELLESGCFDFTLLEMAGLQAKPPQQFIRTVTFEDAKKICEENSTVPIETALQLRNVINGIISNGIKTNVTVSALEAQRRLRDNDTKSFTVLELLQTALNFSENELITTGILNVTSDNLGFLNTSLDDLSCIAGLSKEKLQSFSLSQVIRLAYSFRPMMARISKVVDERRGFLMSASLLQAVNNDSDALSNKTLLQLAAGDVPGYFAPFILKVSCQEAIFYNFTISTLAELMGENKTDLENKLFFAVIQNVSSIKTFLMIKIQVRKTNREEIEKLSKIYNITLEDLAQLQQKPVEEILSMTLTEVNSLYCYNSLFRYAEKKNKSMRDVAEMRSVNESQLRDFRICRTILPQIIFEEVTYLLGYPASTTNSLLNCNIAKAPTNNYVDKCRLLRNNSLAFAAFTYSTLSLSLYENKMYEIVLKFFQVLDGDIICGTQLTRLRLNKLKVYSLSRIEKELKMDKYTIFTKSFWWIIYKVIYDVDECSRGISRCERYGRCINTLLSYECRCPEQGRYKEPYCEDIDECNSREHPHNCSERKRCKNVPGSFSCVCLPGYVSFNETYCKDEDECEDNQKNDCWHSNKNCINTIGSYECACRAGLRTVQQTKCVDIEECDQTPPVCGHIPNARCINSYGSYRCECPTGYDNVLNRTNNELQNCTDRDECSLNSGLCKGRNEMCSNRPGSYSCVCKDGYERRHGRCVGKRFRIISPFVLRSRRGSYQEIQIPSGLPFCGKVYYSLWIRYNGMLTIGKSYFKSNPKDLNRLKENVIASFWANTDLGRDSRIEYLVLKRDDEGQANVLGQISRFIDNSEGLGGSFNASWALVVLWQNLSPYARICRGFAIGPFCIGKKYNPYLDEKNTFEIVVATNGTNTYAVNFYDNMGWNRDELNRKAVVGFSSVGSCRRQHSQSFNNGIFQISGHIVYSLNAGTIPPLTDEQRCVIWYDSEPKASWEKSVPSCPCDENSARISSDFMIVKGSDMGSRVTYQLVSPFDGHGRLCVYRRFIRWSWFRFRWVWRTGSLLTGPDSGSRAQRYHWSMSTEYDEHDAKPYKICCDSTTTRNRQCRLFYEKRPTERNCRRRSRRRRGWFFGDPHITTLDGFKYTFNGLGDYILININNTFAFHGRTARPRTPAGELANATVFSGFAISATEDTVQVHFSAIKPDNMSITVASTSNCSHYMLSDFEDVKFFEKISLRKSSEKNKTLIVIANGGITVEISPGLVGMLNLAVTLPDDMMNRTEGLMGKLNGDKRDDVAYRNGTIVHVTNATSIESQREVFEMGQSWKVKDYEKMFMNNSCFKENVFFDGNFTPAFFSMDSLGDLRTSAVQSCGDNLECLFDIAQTRNLAVGKETMGFEEENNKIKETLDNEPPEITEPTIVRAVVNETVEIQVSALDPNNDTLDYMVSGLPATATFDNVTRKLTWNVTNANNVSIIIVVTDEKEASTLKPLIVHLCNCHNQGVCLNETIFGIGTVNFQFLKCSCPTWFEGDFCENKRDPCASKPCYDDTVTCTANRTADQGYTCSACPNGLTGDGENCVVIDQCAIDNGECEQICKFNASATTCACRPGYKLNEDGKNCTDIDECHPLTGSNDCAGNASCTNGPGNYSCACKIGFEGDPKKGCTDIDECKNGVAKCSQICTNTLGSFSCSCKKGFQLTNDSTTCKDIDECKFEVNNNCQMKCENLISTYNCSCPAGFNLNSDHRTCDVEPSSRCDSTNGGCVNGQCTNSSGNVTCHCEVGFNLNGKTCNDVDECQGSDHGCSQRCNNVQGGYNCLCKPGFVLLDDKRNCKDVDECKSKPCSNQATCNNTEGSYQCECKAGYRGDGKICSNIDECKESSPCTKDKKCQDLPGSYSCSCPPRKADLGFGCTRVKKFKFIMRIVRLANKVITWNPAYEDRTSSEYVQLIKQIKDNVNKFWMNKNKFRNKYKNSTVDSIRRGSVNANVSLIFDANATVTTADLTNELGNSGNVGDLGVDPSASRISDFNECSQPETNDCHSDATCINTDGSYECKCKDGFEGDGQKCEPEITELSKKKDNTTLILAIVIPLVCILVLLVFCCVCVYLNKKRSRKSAFTSDEQHAYIEKHQLSERGAGRPIRNTVEAIDKEPIKRSLSNEESLPDYETVGTANSYTTFIPGAHVNQASSQEISPDYENPGAYEKTPSDGSTSLYDNPDATGFYDLAEPRATVMDAPM